MMNGNYAAVVGGINIDICGKSFLPMIPGDSNPGKVSVALGGVARNIAHNLRLMGADVCFLTAFGEDDHAHRIETSCAELGIDISRARKVRSGSTPVYVYLNDADGDMLMAVSDMELCGSITPSYLSSHSDVLNGATVIAADTNIPEESLKWLAENCPAPLFIDSVSVRKSEKLRGIIGQIHTLKANIREAELLTGIAVNSREGLESAAALLLDQGVKQVFITLGNRGALAADSYETLYVPAFPSDVKSTTGAGDAFTASLVCSHLDGACLEEMLLRASAAASITAESLETVSRGLSAERILERAEMLKPGTLRFSSNNISERNNMNHD